MRPCWPQWMFFVCVILLGTGQMLTACGNKGPLVLPGDESTPVTNGNDQPPVQSQSEVEKAD